jgi:hypothetical protein
VISVRVIAVRFTKVHSLFFLFLFIEANSYYISTTGPFGLCDQRSSLALSYTPLEGWH